MTVTTRFVRLFARVRRPEVVGCTVTDSMSSKSGRHRDRDAFSVSERSD